MQSVDLCVYNNETRSKVQHFCFEYKSQTILIAVVELLSWYFYQYIWVFTVFKFNFDLVNLQEKNHFSHLDALNAMEFDFCRKIWLATRNILVFFKWRFEQSLKTNKVYKKKLSMKFYYGVLWKTTQVKLLSTFGRHTSPDFINNFFLHLHKCHTLHRLSCA